MDKNYLKKNIVHKMESADTSIFWKFLFYIMIYLHLIILFTILIYGAKQNF